MMAEEYKRRIENSFLVFFFSLLDPSIPTECDTNGTMHIKVNWSQASNSLGQFSPEKTREWIKTGFLWNNQHQKSLKPDCNLLFKNVRRVLDFRLHLISTLLILQPRTITSPCDYFTSYRSGDLVLSAWVIAGFLRSSTWEMFIWKPMLQTVWRKFTLVINRKCRQLLLLFFPQKVLKVG